MSNPEVKRLKLDMEGVKKNAKVHQNNKIIEDQNKSEGTNKARGDVVAVKTTYRTVLARMGYIVHHTLGSGSYSKVKAASNFKTSSNYVAIKIIDRQKAPKDYLEKFLPRELAVWPGLKHSNLVSLFDHFTDGRRHYMVLEFASGGDVLTFIQKNGARPDAQARAWTRQLCDAVRYMHDQGITHRDLKLENLLLTGDEQIKVADFGFVKADSTSSLSMTYCGSKSYAAPEILEGRPYDPRKSDVWAIGVILYILVTGRMPFDESKGTKHVLGEQRRLVFPWCRQDRVVSILCQQLILHVFTWNYQERPLLQTVVQNAWFNQKDKLESHSFEPNQQVAAPAKPIQKRTKSCTIALCRRK